MIEDIRVSRTVNSTKKEALKIGVKSGAKWYFSSPPCGTSRGKHEARDVDFATAKSLIPEVKKKLVGMQEDYREVDAAIKNLDRTGNFSRIGGNLALGLSIATARAQTKNNLFAISGKKNAFPCPLVNVIGGGKHGGNTDFQEFLVLPYKEKTFPDAYKRAREIWLLIGSELKKRKLLLGKNLENAWITRMNEVKTLEFIQSLELDIKLGIDCAASSFWNGKQYVYSKSNKKCSKKEHFEFIEFLMNEFNIFYMEDAFHEDDFESFAELNKKFRKRLVVGDDLTTTSPERFKKALGRQAISGIIIKPNQVGNLSLVQEVVEMAKKNGIVIVPSHRSSETRDDWMGDLCIAMGAGIFKSGIVGYDKPKLERLAHLWKKLPGAKMKEIR
jgi:enolase